MLFSLFWLSFSLASPRKLAIAFVDVALGICVWAPSTHVPRVWKLRGTYRWVELIRASLRQIIPAILMLSLAAKKFNMSTRSHRIPNMSLLTKLKQAKNQKKNSRRKQFSIYWAATSNCAASASSLKNSLKRTFPRSTTPITSRKSSNNTGKNKKYWPSPNFAMRSSWIKNSLKLS